MSKPARSKPTPGYAAEILRRLKRMYPDADCELTHQNAFQLLVAVILSARTTDKAVNLITPALFQRYPNAAALAAATPAEVEPLVSTIGLYRNKAKMVVDMARALVERHAGEVPRDRESLESLAGVGRKTANVVLATAFKEPALAVDTHVARLAGVLKLSRETEPDKIEADLTALFVRPVWGFASHALIWHGRRVCIAQRPRCPECGLNDICPSARLEPPAPGRKIVGAKRVVKRVAKLKRSAGRRTSR